MKTDNELIAEFMGCPVYKTYADVQAVPIDELKPYYLFDQLDFDQSWNSLMPVVEKINTTIHPVLKERIDVIIYRRTCHINDMQQIMIETTGNNMLDCTYKAVVEFIKWYNAQPK